MNLDLSLKGLGDLAKPATALVKVIAEAFGTVYEPVHLKKMADAKAYEKRIATISELDCDELTRRTISRMAAEETKHQENIEVISTKSIPYLSIDAEPEKMQPDWVTHFFEHSRLVSDHEMQELWARVLAGEANSPGKFSMRTVAYLPSLDKADAELFTRFCSTLWSVGDLLFPVLLPEEDGFEATISYPALMHLEQIGLIAKVEWFSGVSVRSTDGQNLVFKYFHKFLDMRVKSFNIGGILLTKTGEELSTLCDAKEDPYVFELLRSRRYGVNVPQVVERSPDIEAIFSFR